MEMQHQRCDFTLGTLAVHTGTDRFAAGQLDRQIGFHALYRRTGGGFGRAGRWNG